MVITLESAGPQWVLRRKRRPGEGLQLGGLSVSVKAEEVGKGGLYTGVMPTKPLVLSVCFKYLFHPYSLI